MTKSQKAICMFLCLCMFVGFAAYLPVFFWASQKPERESGILAQMLPLMTYCKTKSAMEPLTEDERTYTAIVEANQAYLAQQVIGENDRGQEETAESLETPEEQGEESAQEIVQEPEPTPAPQQTEETVSQSTPTQRSPAVEIAREKLEDYEYLIDNFFIVDANTATNSDQISASALLDKDMSLPQDTAAPQILIYHSHSQETYADSVAGDPGTSIVGVGDTLVSILQETYGYGVIHVTDSFDVVNGEIDRSGAYDYSRAKVEQLLAENPSVQVTIDLHRDGVPEDRHLVTEVDGKPTAQIMFFNGLSYSAKNGNIEYLPNPNIAENLAFSFQLQLASAQYFPGFNRPIYLSSLRYNLHLRPRALLIEVGAQNNTVEEARNAMAPLAWILNKVLKGE